MSAPRERLRIAVQKSGRLAQPSRDLLARCGLEFRGAGDELVLPATNAPVDLLLVRDDDVPAMLAAGACELGIVGRNVLRESGCEGIAEKRALAGLLRELRTQGMAVLLVEHDMDFVMSLADRIVVLDFGVKISELFESAMPI